MKRENYNFSFGTKVLGGTLSQIGGKIVLVLLDIERLQATAETNVCNKLDETR